MPVTSSLSLRDPSHYLIFVPNSAIAEMGSIGSVKAYRLFMLLCAHNHRKNPNQLTYVLDYPAISLSDDPKILQSNIKRDFEKLKKEFSDSDFWRKRINISRFSYQGSGYALTFTLQLQVEFKKQLVVMTSLKTDTWNGVLGFTKVDQALVLPQLQTVERNGETVIETARNEANICFTSRFDLAMHLLLREYQYQSGNEKKIILSYRKLCEKLGCADKYINRPDNFIVRVLRPCCQRFLKRKLWTSFEFTLKRIRRNSGEEPMITLTIRTDNGIRLALNQDHRFEWEETLLKDFKGQVHYFQQIKNLVVNAAPLLGNYLWNARYVGAVMKLVDQKVRNGKNGLVINGKKSAVINDKGKYLYDCLVSGRLIKEAEDLIREEECRAAQQVQEREEILSSYQTQINKLKQGAEKPKPQQPVKSPETTWFKPKSPDEIKYPKDQFKEFWQVDPEYKSRPYEEYLSKQNFELQGDFIVRRV